MARNLSTMYEDLYILAMVSSTLERNSTEITPYLTECSTNGATTCTGNIIFRRNVENHSEEAHSKVGNRILTRMPGDEILYGPKRFWKKRECHRCVTNVDLKELEQRIENLRDVFDFWEFLRSYLQTKTVNPLLEGAICAFAEHVKRL